MAAKPSDTEIAAIVDSQTLAEWCGFDTAVPSASGSGPALVSPLQAFLVGLGLGPTEHYRVIAALSPEDYKTGSTGVTFNGKPPTLKEHGAMMLFH